MIPEKLIYKIDPLSPQDRVIEVSERFAKCPKLARVLSLPVVRDDIVVGVISRHKLDKLMLTRYGRDLHGSKTMLEIMNLNPIIVDIKQPLMDISQVISNSISSPIIEDFVVVDEDCYQGIGFVTDILKLMELKLRERTTELNIALKAKNQFFANMSHEIRTPMNGMIGMLDMLRETQLDNTQKDYLKTVESSCQQLVSLINDILDFSKFEAGKLSLECVAIKLPELIQECLDMVYGSALKKGLELCVYLAPDVPDKVLGDPVRLKQVIINLLNNAIKFTSKGFVALHVLKDHLQPVFGKPRLRIEVVDSGIGIAENKISELFKDFAQAEQSTYRNYGGSGLGLAICKRIIDLHEGEIGVDSEPGHGSMFWFTAQFLSHPEEVEYREDLSTYPGELQFPLNGEQQHYIRRQLEVWSTPTGNDHHWLARSKNIDAIQEYRTHFIDNPDKIDELQQSDDKPNSSKRTKRLNHRFILLTDTPHSHRELLNDASVALLQKPVTPNRLANAIKQLQIQNQQDRTNPTIAVPQPIGKGIQFEQRNGFNHLRVLVAEDNKVNRKVICAYLKKLQVNWEVTENGRDALESFKASTDYDVILMDCEMPVMDGWTASRAIHDYCQTNDIADPIIIACSAHALTMEKDRTRSAGMDDYLAKPLRLNQLIKVFDRHGLRRKDPQASCSVIY